MKTNKNATRLPALLLAAALLIWLAGGAYLRWGWPRESFRPETVAGDAQALQGFSLAGSVSTTGVGISFLIRDGRAESRPYWTYSERQAGQYNYCFYTCLLLTLPEEQRSQAEAEAERQEIHSGGGSQLGSDAQKGWRTVVEPRRVQRMLEVSVGPWEEVRCLRLDLGTVELETPVWMYSEQWEDGSAEDYGIYDGNWVNSCGVIPLLLEGNYYFVLTDPVDPANSGLWRVDDTLSEAEAAALPRTAEVAGVPVAPNYAGYGEASLLWRTPEGQTVCDITSAGGKICLLTQDGAGETSLLVLNADGSLCSAGALGCYPQSDAGDGSCPYLKFGRSLRSDEVGVVYYREPQKETVVWQALQLRMEDGEITKRASAQGSGTDGDISGLMMNEEGDRLLVATEEALCLTFHGDVDAVAVPVNTAVLHLAVYALQEGRAGETLYEGRVRTGAELTARGQLISPTSPAGAQAMHFSSRGWWSLSKEAEREAAWPGSAAADRS